MADIRIGVANWSRPMKKVRIEDSSFEGNEPSNIEGGAVRIGYGFANIEIVNSQFTNNKGHALLIEGPRESIARRLGLKDLPHDQWKAFLDCLNQGQRPEEAVEK